MNIKAAIFVTFMLSHSECLSWKVQINLRVLPNFRLSSNQSNLVLVFFLRTTGYCAYNCLHALQTSYDFSNQFSSCHKTIQNKTKYCFHPHLPATTFLIPPSRSIQLNLVLFSKNVVIFYSTHYLALHGAKILQNVNI